MLVTTKGRYAMRLMIYIASSPDRKVTLREVAENEGISLKYLEQLAHDMVASGLLNSMRGHGGGYLLSRPAAKISAGDILRAAEGTTGLPSRKGVLYHLVLVRARPGHRGLRRQRHPCRPRRLGKRVIIPQPP